MKRGGPIKRLAPLVSHPREPKNRPQRVAGRRRDTGPSASTRKLVWTRSGGFCESCGRDVVDMPHSIHHRRPRRMGGSSDPATNSPANLLLLCGSGTSGCHGRIEGNRHAAIVLGQLLHARDEPAKVAVFHHRRGLVFLNDDGTWTEAGQEKSA